MNDPLTPLVAQLKERRSVTFQEKLKTLDIRDEIWRKYIELNRNSTADSNASQRIGLCADMCCERERITREFQRLFKFYELDPDTRALNHPMMVTEYSRSSADQAMPSPYDLRSGPALLHTMNYLITNVVDKFDQEREHGDWYNFLWDRLRAIRKELTQQHLRDEIAIEILELCARFHIFCAAFLSELSRDLFDPKLNDGMLIDCLNQLHGCYMIHKKSNNLQALKNISEFSSYMLLINLKDDNETLLRIRHLIQDLTQRREISVALDIHRSLLLNNTTKFFGSIERDATLLQSCLLHRYFTIIRSKRFHALLTSGRANDQVPISDLTDILGMDSDDETKDYLDQLEYPITDTDPVCFIIPSANNISQQQSTSRLSQKLIKSKYAGNLKDIITGQTNAPVVIPDTTIENSFDVHGGFVGKLPFDLDVYAPAPPRRPLHTPQEPPVRPQQPLPAKRPPSESARRSMAATTTENTFVMRSRPMPAENLFSSDTTATAVQSPFRFGGFSQDRISVAPTSTQQSSFLPATLPSRLFSNPLPSLMAEPAPLVSSHRPSPTSTRYVAPVPQPILSPVARPALVPEKPVSPLHTPVLAPIARRLSTNSMDTFIDELYEQMLHSVIQETTYSIYDDLVSRWNKLVSQTFRILDEFILDEVSSIATAHCDEVEFHQKMLNDTLREQNERQRKKFLQRKYLSIWWTNYSRAKEERSILNDLQTKFHFLNNEQLLEFLTGLQLIGEHALTIEQTTEILKCRRYLKQDRLRKVSFVSNLLFEQLLDEEFDSLVRESNDELRLRERLLHSALEKQSTRRRHRYLCLKYASLWLLHCRRRKHVRQQELVFNKNRKRSSIFLQLSNPKKIKDHHQQYDVIKNSFDQLANDLQQIQVVIDQLRS